MLNVLKSLMERKRLTQQQQAAAAQADWEKLVGDLVRETDVSESRVESVVERAGKSLEDLQAAVDNRKLAAKLQAEINLYDDLRAELRTLGERETKNKAQWEEDQKRFQKEREAIEAGQGSTQAKLQRVQEAQKELNRLPR